MSRTIVLSNNKLDFVNRNDATESFVKFNFSDTEIKANATVLAAAKDLTVGGNANITGKLDVTGTSTLAGTLNVTGASVLSNTLTVASDSTLSGKLDVSGTSTLSALNVNGISTLSALNAGASNLSSLAVTGASNLNGGLNVNGESILSNKLTVQSNGIAVTGMSVFSDRLTVQSNGMSIYGNSTFNNNLTVTGDSNLGKLAAGVSNLSGLTVTTSSNLKGLVSTAPSTFTQGLSVVGTTAVTGSLIVGGTAGLDSLGVTNATTLASTLDAGDSTLKSLTVKTGGASTLKGALTVLGVYPTALGGTLGVTGDSTLSGNMTVGGASNLAATQISSTLNVTGLSTLGALNAQSSTLSSVNVTGASSLGGTLNVTGDSTLGKLAVNGDSVLTGKLDVTGNSNVSGNFAVTGASILNTLNAQATNLATLVVAGNASFKSVSATDPSSLGDLALNGNLTISGNTTMSQNLNVTKSSYFNDKLTVNNGGMEVTGVSSINGAFHVNSTSNLNGKVTVTGDLDIISGTLAAPTAYISTLEAAKLNVSQMEFIGLSAMLDNTRGHTQLKTLNVNGNADLSSNFSVTGNSALAALTLSNNLTVNAVSNLNDKLTISANGMEVTGDTDLKDHLTVRGVTSLLSNIVVGGDSALYGKLTVSGNSVLNGNLTAGKSSLSDKLTISANGMDVTGYSVLNNDLQVVGTSYLNALEVTNSGLAHLSGNLQVDKNATITGTLSGGASTLDSLTVTNASNLNGLSVTGASDLKGALTVGLADAKVESKFYGNVEINGNFNVTGTGTKTILNTEELKVKDTTITIGEGNTADTVKMALEMAYKTGATDYKAGLRRLPGGNDGFHLFKNCVNDSDAIIYDSLTVETLACYSDINLKKNIVTIDGALDKLDGIRGVYHDWINTKQSEDRQIGVIAQEVQAVYPELVHENENGYLTVNYPKLTAVLLQSIKELKAMVLEICAKQAL